MKKILAVLILGIMLAPMAYSEPVDWETFQAEIFAEYPWVDYVSYKCYEQWNGDAKAFIQWLKDNPTDLGAEEEEA